MGFLEDRYELGAPIGDGAVGSVYMAFDTVLGIDVAVKIMHEEHILCRSMLERFSLEANVAARMMSPHIVKVLGLAITRAGAPCIVYEYLEGETLASFLARRGPLSLAETNEIVKQVARALVRVHSLGIVHRDVKPENILITTQPDGHALIKLIDFGVAEKMIPDSPREELVGTAEYMAPEIIAGSVDIDARVDLYALGVVAFECLTGTCPFVGSRISNVFAAILRGSRASLAQLRPDLGPEVEQWIDSALQPDPYWRFGSAKELARSLEAATNSPRKTRVAAASGFRKAA